MNKMGGSGFTPKNWRRRWFVLKSTKLYYYKTSFVSVVCVERDRENLCVCERDRKCVCICERDRRERVSVCWCVCWCK